MGILTAILIFIVGSISAACDGDFSGLEVIAKVVGVLITVVAVMWLFTHPVVLMIVIAIIVVVCCISGSK